MNFSYIEEQIVDKTNMSMRELFHAMQQNLVNRRFLVGRKY